MISKRIHCIPENDNYNRLANYIAGHDKNQERENAREYMPQSYLGEIGELAQKRLRGLSECDLVHRTLEEGTERESESILSFDARGDHQSDDFMRWNGSHARAEKCLISWCAGCWAGDDYELAMQEVADTQALNTRTTKEKTYHLIVSFRPEDQGRLTPENFKAIERRFAEVLGLSEHQRHCGVHVNTNNTHMHVAYNLIHPERLTRTEPWHDYIARDKLCRQLEKEYGLTVDNGRQKDRERGIGSQAATMEAHSGRQSFESYAHDQGAAILEKLESARTWEDVHQIFARHGLELMPRGAGLVVRDRHGKQTAKASTVHREVSFRKLQARFGTFQKAREKLPPSEIRYHPRPIQKAAELEMLWTEFKAARMVYEAERAAIRRKWSAYREAMDRQTLGQKTRRYVLQLSRQKEMQERQALEMRQPGNWMEFLRHKARSGDEAALTVLRSRQEEVLPDMEREGKQMQARAAMLAQKTAILENDNLNSKTKRRLSSQVLMESLLPGVKTDISRHGHLIYTLPDGEKICDSGKRITFSEGARSHALRYMAAQWGIRHMERDKEGRSVFVLADGQKIRDTGQRTFERPKPRPQLERKQEMER